MHAPLFATLRKHFPDPERMGIEELYRWIGYPENAVDISFANTGAVRMSLALLGAGFPNPGLFRVKAGRYKGRMLETRQRMLCDFLTRQLEAPEKYSNGQDAEQLIGSRHGIIAFFQLHGPADNPGHMALVERTTWDSFRAGTPGGDRPGGCFWDAVDVWFWPFP